MTRYVVFDIYHLPLNHDMASAVMTEEGESNKRIHVLLQIREGRLPQDLRYVWMQQYDTLCSKIEAYFDCHAEDHSEFLSWKKGTVILLQPCESKHGRQ
ncbi:MAG: hypothetical protein PHV49_01910 [Alistipes sp.]|nr:hypothetical protein [Alistipes sp.]